MITLRVRTKDGMERLQVEATATVAAVRELISTQLGVPLGSHRALLVAAHLALRTNWARRQEGRRSQPC